MVLDGAGGRCPALDRRNGDEGQPVGVYGELARGGQVTTRGEPRASRHDGCVEAVTADAIIAERRAFAETLAIVGPDAASLCGTWRAADVAAHVVSLDRFGGLPTFVGRTIVSRGLRLNDAAGRFADTNMKSTRRRGFDWALGQLRSSPPGLLLRRPVAPIGLFEVFVHHEDVRRATGPVRARSAPDGVIAVVPWLLRYHRSVLPQLRLVVRADDLELATGNGPIVVLEGSAAEVVLWLARRQDVANVQLNGDPNVVRDLSLAAIRI